MSRKNIFQISYTIIFYFILFFEFSQAVVKPTTRPTKAPVTRTPTTHIPSVYPTVSTDIPTDSPTIEPSLLPTSFIPTKIPTILPSFEPTLSPTNIPSCKPTLIPTYIPTLQPVLTNRPSSKEPINLPTMTPQVLSYTSSNPPFPLIGNSASNLNTPYLPALPISEWFIILGAIIAGCICCGGAICFCFDRYRGKKVTHVRTMELSSPTNGPSNPGSSARPGSTTFNPMSSPSGNLHYRNSQTVNGSDLWRGDTSVSSVASYGLNPNRVGSEDFRVWEQSVDGHMDPFASGPNSAANSRVNSAAYSSHNNYSSGNDYNTNGGGGYYNSNNNGSSGSRVNSSARGNGGGSDQFPVYDPQLYQNRNSQNYSQHYSDYPPDIVVAIPLDR